MNHSLTEWLQVRLSSYIMANLGYECYSVRSLSALCRIEPLGTTHPSWGEGGGSEQVVIPDEQITTYTSVAAVIQWIGMLEVQIYSYASCSSVQYTNLWLVELVHYKIRSSTVSVSFHCRRLNSSNGQLKRSMLILLAITGMLILLAIHSHTCIPMQKSFNQHRNVSDLT